MVDALLQAGDVLRGLLEAHQNGSVADEAQSAAICVKLENLTNHPAVAKNPTGDMAGANKQPDRTASSSVRGQSTTAIEPPPAFEQHTYQIQFANTQTAFPSEAHLNNLFEELSNIGHDRKPAHNR